MNAENLRLLAERAYPGLEPSRFCSMAHATEDEQVRCTICYPDLRALIDAHNDLKQAAWSALGDIRAEMTHGVTANWEYISQRVDEGLSYAERVAASAPTQRDTER